MKIVDIVQQLQREVRHLTETVAKQEAAIAEILANTKAILADITPGEAETITGVGPFIVTNQE